jgi:hypothetical protein
MSPNLYIAVEVSALNSICVVAKRHVRYACRLLGRRLFCRLRTTFDIYRRNHVQQPFSVSYEASQHESGVAVLRRSCNTAMPLWYSGAVSCCFAVRLDQATSQRCSTTSLLGTVNRSVYNLNIVFYRLKSFQTDAPKSEKARGSPRWWQVAAQQRLVVL